MIMGVMLAEASPVPWTLNVNVPFTTSLLLIVTVPVCRPTPVGTNLIWKVVLAPAASESLAGWLTMLKSAPLTDTGVPPVSVSVELPVFLIVYVSTTEPVISVTEPKLVPLPLVPLANSGVPPGKMPTELPLTAISPATVPVPSILTTKLGFTGSLLAIVIVPVSSVAAVGTNVTWKVVEVPGASESTAGWLTSENPAPLTVIGVAPVSVSVSCRRCC